MKKLKNYVKLFLIFAKIGAVTFGGGYAMLPILTREIVEVQGWVTEDELLDYYAVGQCTPGPIAVNTATFVGNRLYGFWGGVVATAGLVCPSVVIITAIAFFIKSFANIRQVQHGLSGIRVAVTVLIFDAVYKMAKKSLVDVPSILIFGAALFIAIFTEVSPAILVILAGLVGYIIYSIKKKRHTDNSGRGGVE